MSIENTIKNLLEESRKFKGQADLDEATAPEGKKKLDAKNSPSDGSGDNEENKKNNVGTEKEAEGGTSKKANAATKGSDTPEGKKSLDKKNALSDGSGMNPDNARNIKVEAKEDDDDEKDVDADEDGKGKSDIEDADDDKDDEKVVKEGKFKEMDIDNQEKEEKKKKKNEDYDMTDDVDALFNGEEGLTEEFRQKAETIFESAVVARIKEEVDRIEEEYNTKLEEQYEQIAESLVDNIDGYLNLMIEQWMEDNQVAVETGIKNDIMESFIGGMKTLFEQHYIDVPEEKYDLVGELESKIEDLSNKLDETFEINVKLKTELNEKHRVEIVDEICEGLTDIEAEKLQSLAEEIKFDDAETFTKKIQTIRENYFSKKTTDNKNVNSFLHEETLEEEKQVPSNMSPYVNALSSLYRK